LPLNAGGLVSLLEEGRFVDEANGLTAAMGNPLDPLVEPRIHEILVPAVKGQELLKIPRMNARVQRHRFNRLARKRTQLALNISGDVSPGGHNRAVVKVLQESIQGGTQRQKLLGLHENPLSNASPRGSSAFGTGVLECFLSL
jgi:hypothetical protein